LRFRDVGSDRGLSDGVLRFKIVSPLSQSENAAQNALDVLHVLRLSFALPIWFSHA
jgi:hypothetical protein